MRVSLGKEVMRLMVLGLYVFLYAPIGYIIYVAFQQDSVWPFPPEWTAEWYSRLRIMSDFHAGLGQVLGRAANGNRTLDSVDAVFAPTGLSGDAIVWVLDAVLLGGGDDVRLEPAPSVEKAVADSLAEYGPAARVARAMRSAVRFSYGRRRCARPQDSPEMRAQR